MLKWSSTTVLLLLLLHKNTDYYRPDNLWIMWLARKKKQICWWQRNLWENFIKVRSPVLPDFWISETTKFFRKRSNWSGFLVVYWRSSHRRPPANVPRLDQPGLAPPIYLPPHFPQKNKTRKVYYFTKEKKKFVVAHSHFLIDFTLF